MQVFDISLFGKNVQNKCQNLFLMGKNENLSEL